MLQIRAGWSSIQAEYEKLWNHLGESNTEAVFNQIYERGNELSKAGTKFPNKPKRLEYWLDSAARIAQARYA